MSSIILDFRPKIKDDHLEELRRILENLEPHDEVQVIMERTDAHQADTVSSMMEEYGLNIQPHGGHHEEYYIIGQSNTYFDYACLFGL